MCGIAGELSFGRPVDPAAIQRMTDAVAHRGPDDEDLYCEGSIGLGHRRLSIIDLSSAGRNPLWTADRTMAIVINGEIYNYQEIRDDLVARGYVFASATDTEVVLNAIHCWGIEAALARLIGMFAFAVWDARDRSLYLVRDRVGIKPLYYARTPASLLFGSELKALYAHPAYEKRFNQQGLAQFFILGYCLGDTTVMADTYKLPPGHYLHATADGRVTRREYWSLAPVARGSFRGSFDAAVEQLESLCDSAFRYRLVSDVPVGVFLSGGIDSTLLSAFLKKRIGADLRHITIGFNDALYDEAPKARQVARELGLHHEVKYVEAPDAREALMRFTDIWDEPFGDTSGIPTSILSKEARRHVTVALSADGGDEQFCGYESYPAYVRRFERLSQLPASVRGVAAAVGRLVPYRAMLSSYLSFGNSTRWNPQLVARYEKALDLLTAAGSADVVRIMNEKGWTEGSVRRLLRDSTEGALDGSVLARSSVTLDADQLMDDMMRTDYTAFLRDDILTKVDRASMAVSLECRDPLLDHRLAEFAFSLPMEFLYKEGEHKRILKHMLRRWISPGVLNAPKRGFVIPLYDWLRGAWKPLVHEYLAPARIAAVGVLDPRTVAEEVDRFYRFRGGRAEKVMLMLNFQMWAERWYLR